MPPADTSEHGHLGTIALPQQRESQERIRTDAPASPALLLVLACFVIPAILAYGFATANELQVFAILVGLIGLVVILARPAWGLVFFVGLLYVRPEESIPVLAGMHFTLIVAAVSLVGMWFQLFLNHQPFVHTPLNGMILGLALVATASSFDHGNMGDTLTDLSRLVILVLLVLNLTRTKENFRALVTAILVFTGYVAAYSIWLFQSGDIVVSDGIARSVSTGIFSDPNDLASIFVPALALALARLKDAGLLARLLYFPLIGVLLWATFLTNSRGGTLSLLVVAGGFFLVFLRRKPMVAVAAALLALGMLRASGRMTTFDSTEASANQRFWYWNTGIDLLRDNPILGVGYNQFNGFNGGMTAHSSFVLCFAELGLLGYFFWIGCLYYAYLRRPQTEKTATDLQGSDSLAVSKADVDFIAQDQFGARLALAAYLMASFWLSHTYTPVLYLFICLAASAQVAVSARPGSYPITWSERWRDWGCIALLCTGSIIFINLMVMHYK